MNRRSFLIRLGAATAVAPFLALGIASAGSESLSVSQAPTIAPAAENGAYSGVSGAVADAEYAQLADNRHVPDWLRATPQRHEAIRPTFRMSPYVGVDEETDEEYEGSAFAWKVRVGAHEYGNWVVLSVPIREITNEIMLEARETLKENAIQTIALIDPSAVVVFDF